MSCEVFEKDADGKKRVIIDWSTWLGSSEIASVAWTVPSGLTDTGEATNTTTTATIYLSGGTDGQEYAVKCCITTNDSPTRIKCQTFHIAVQSTCA